MEVKVKEILSRILEIAVEEIDEETSPDTVESWDSLRHMNLVMALEEEFGVQFTDIQIVEMLTYPLIVVTLKELKPG